MLDDIFSSGNTLGDPYLGIDEEDYALLGYLKAKDKMDNAEEYISHLVGLSRVELVIYPRDVGMLVLHLDWKPNQVDNLLLSQLRTYDPSFTTSSV